MDTIFLNSENSKTSNSNGLLLSLSDKIKLKRGDEHVISTCYYIQWKKRNLYKNNALEISAPTWNHKFKLPNE